MTLNKIDLFWGEKNNSILSIYFLGISRGLCLLLLGIIDYFLG